MSRTCGTFERNAHGHRLHPDPRICLTCGQPFRVTVNKVKTRNPRFCSFECTAASLRGKPTACNLQFKTPASTSGQRQRAQALIAARVDAGWYERPSHCVRCYRRRRTESHHPDYDRPAEVIYLCHGCHMRAHNDPSILVGLPLMDTDLFSPAHPVPGERRSA